MEDAPCETASSVAFIVPGRNHDAWRQRRQRTSDGGRRRQTASQAAWENGAEKRRRRRTAATAAAAGGAAAAAKKTAAAKALTTAPARTTTRLRARCAHHRLRASPAHLPSPYLCAWRPHLAISGTGKTTSGWRDFGSGQQACWDGRTCLWRMGRTPVQRRMVKAGA